MRIRTVKPEFFDSPDTAKASAATRLAFIGLWCCADDTGRGTCNLKELEGEIFPNDDVAELSHGEVADFGGLLRQVAAAYGVVFYRVSGRPYYEIPSWSKHQRVREDRKSRFPGPDDGEILLTRDDAQLAASGGQWRPTAADGGNRRPGTGEQGNRGTGEYNARSESDSGSALVPVGAVADAPETSKKTMAEPKGFAEFYEAYPRHTGRRKAAQEFAKATRETTPAELVTAAIAFRQACQHNRTEQKFIPHPATWLHQDRWADAPEILEDRPAGGLDWDAMMADAAAEDAARGLA